MPDEKEIWKVINRIIEDSGLKDDILMQADYLQINPMELINRVANELKMRV